MFMIQVFFLNRWSFMNCNLLFPKAKRIVKNLKWNKDKDKLRANKKERKKSCSNWAVIMAWYASLFYYSFWYCDRINEILPSDQNDYCCDDCSQKYETTESTQCYNCSQIQFSTMRLTVLIIFYQIWNVHIRWLIRSENKHWIRAWTFDLKMK